MNGLVLASELDPGDAHVLRGLLPPLGFDLGDAATSGEGVAVIVHGGDAEGMARLAAAHPEAARVWVCDPQPGLCTRVRGVGAHEGLVRPLTREGVGRTMARARDVHRLLADPTLRAHSEAFGAMPAVPVTYQRLCQVVAREGSSTLDVADVIGRDVAVATKVLTVVNSAVFQLPRRIASLKEAVGLLGLDTVRDVVLSVEVLTCLGRRGDCSDLEQRQRLAHARASLARVLSPRPMAGTAFTTGLLTDLGMMLVVARRPDLARAIADAVEGGAEVEAAEEQVLGLPARELGARLLALWGLPGDVVAAVLEPKGTEPVAQLVDLAGTFVGEAMHEAATHEAVEWVTPDMVEPWGLERRVDLARHLARGLVRGCSALAA